MLLTKQETAEAYYEGTTQPLREQDKTLVFAFSEAFEAKLIAKLCAGVSMPEAFLGIYEGDVCYKSKEDDQSYGMWIPVDTNYAPPFNGTLYTADQLRAYGAACRVKALEDCLNEIDGWANDQFQLKAAIRALKGEA